MERPPAIIKTRGSSGKNYYIGLDDGYGLKVSWRGADTFFCVGQSDAVLVEGGMDIPAHIEFMGNGFVRVSLDFGCAPFNIHFKDAESILNKFSVYVTCENETIDRICSIEVAR